MFAQQESSTWYFGFGAGLKFDLDNESLTTLNDGKLSTDEGCASVSDQDGNLLFYTDGVTVWNKDHNIMLNGEDLLGDRTSTQTAIVPQPNNSDIYYIFTLDNYNRNPNIPSYGFNYSIVDMSIDDGLGGIDLNNKNINILPYCSEKVAATFDCRTGEIWVLTFSTESGERGQYNTFWAFKIDDYGLDVSNPVKSTFNFNPILFDARGYLKIAPDGNKLAIANNSENSLFLFDFNVFNGKVTNKQQLLLNSQSVYPYGVEFSPNSQFLYVSSSNDEDPNSNDDSDLYYTVITQFDLNENNIQDSETVIDQSQLLRGALQLGPDGKIYKALSKTWIEGVPYLDVINNPDAKGLACDYQRKSVNLDPYNSYQGLPPLIPVLYNQRTQISINGESVDSVILCEGETYLITTIDIPGAIYKWYLNGQILPESNFDLLISEIGFYEVYVDPNNGDCPLRGSLTVTCEISETISIPKFFTPNNDNYNDFWKVMTNMPDLLSNAGIHIFDRYGKLLKQLDPFGRGWDGTYKNNPMPSDDYWYVVELLDGRIFKGHFTLKR